MPTQARAVGVIQNLQILRAIAALMVVFIHFDTLLQSAGLPPFSGGGVDIFFVISGFIMVYTTAGRTEVTSFSFMAERIARIVPIYWLLTIAAFSIALVFPALFETTRANWNELAKSLLFIPFLKGSGFVAPVLFVGWTLNYEMFFYLLFAMSLFPAKRIWGIAAVIVSLFCLVAIQLLHGQHGVAAQFYTSIVILNFASGMLLGLAHHYIPRNVAFRMRLTVALAACVGLVAVMVLPSIFPAAPSFVVCGLPACLVVGGAVALERWGWVVTSKLARRLGNASYSIYLVHPFVAQAAQKLAGRWPANAAISMMLMAAALVATCMAGLFTHRFLEQPLSTACRHLLKAKRLNPQFGGPQVDGPHVGVQGPVRALAMPSVEH